MNERGFTLVELLVALFVFSLLAVAGTALLAFGVDAQARTAERLGDMAGTARLRALLTADIGQAAPRPWRDESGTRRPALTSDATTVLALVRRGWSNEGGAARSSLQRVEYRLNDGRLERWSAPLVDGAAAGPPAVLAGDVTALRLRFRAAGEWQQAWEPATGDLLPDAVEVTLAAGGAPPVRQVLLVGPGPRR